MKVMVIVKATADSEAGALPDRDLMAAAKHRAIDHLRQRALHADRQTEYGVKLQVHGADMAHDNAGNHADDDIGDDLLRLVFVACHPVLPLESQVALILRLLGGLTTGEIARAFLQPEPTVAQRIVRAKRTLAEKQSAFDVPRKAELAERLDAVLEAIYLIFNEGYAATSGEDWMRPALLVDALCEAAQLKYYGLLYAVRGDLFEQLGRRDEARVEFERAAALASNARADA